MLLPRVTHSIAGVANPPAPVQKMNPSSLQVLFMLDTMRKIR